jgi:N-acetyl-gamma-glutamyl-phosphate reductase
MDKKQVGLVGVTGYTGMELARLIAGHPHMELRAATSRAEAGRKLGEIFPHLAGFDLAELTVEKPETRALAEQCEVVFLAVPHGTAMSMGAALVREGVRVVDLSADFRIKDPVIYSHWYETAHEHPELLSEAVYGLPEIYSDRIPDAKLIANPGCYPISVILALYPVLLHGLIQTDDIVADSKSGASGAGRAAKTGTLFCEVADNFRAYNLGRHRHTPEIEQELSAVSGKVMRISFNTHLLPVNRGILSTVYTKLPEGVGLEDARRAFEEVYAGARWLRLLPKGSLPEVKNVRGSMFCDLGLVHDQRTGRLIIVSAIDNLCRGASGQALANANLMLGLPVETGLEAAPMAP